MFLGIVKVWIGVALIVLPAALVHDNVVAFAEKFRKWRKNDKEGQE